MLSLTLKRLGLLAVALVVAGCAPGPTPAASSQKPQRDQVTIRLVSDWDVLHPHALANVSSRQIAPAMYETFTSIAPDLKTIPYLAKSWTEKPGSITFEVRTDATCSDGTPLTAAAMADSFKNQFASTNAAVKAQLTRNFGPAPYAATAPDATHVSFTFSTPITGTAVNFSEVTLGIMCPAGFAANANTETTSYGSGPYVLTTAVHGDSATATLRPEWKWGPNGTTSANLAKKLSFKVIADQTTAANLLLTGGIDLGPVTGPGVERLLNDKSLKNGKAGGAAAAAIIYNQTAGRPGADKALREALSTAIDRSAYNIAASAGLDLLSSSIVSPFIPCFDASTASLLPTPSATKAKSLLQAGGYNTGADGKVLGKDGKPLAITLIGTTDSGAGPEYLAAQWTSLGVAVTLRLLTAGDSSTTTQAGNYDAFVFRYTNSLPSIPALAPFWTGTYAPAGNNRGRIANAAATAAMNAAVQASTPEQACKDWGVWQRELLTNYDTLPLASVQIPWFSRGLDFIPYYFAPIWSIR